MKQNCRITTTEFFNSTDDPNRDPIQKLHLSSSNFGHVVNVLHEVTGESFIDLLDDVVKVRRLLDLTRVVVDDRLHGRRLDAPVYEALAHTLLIQAEGSRKLAEVVATN